MANAFAQHFKQVYKPNHNIIEGHFEKHILESFELDQRQSTSQTHYLVMDSTFETIEITKQIKTHKKEKSSGNEKSPVKPEAKWPKKKNPMVLRFDK